MASSKYKVKTKKMTNKSRKKIIEYNNLIDKDNIFPYTNLINTSNGHFDSHCSCFYHICGGASSIDHYGTEYAVGDASGWTINYDYKAWVKDKVFYVGDKLVFKYPVNVHNVYKVNASSFATCTISPPGTGLTSGNDVVTLMTPGKKWYICGVEEHCADFNQKLVIDVQSMNPAPAPSTGTKYGSKTFMPMVIFILATIVMV
ncbi:unnamed protein product [Lactuca saligna]|uniref:Phytocyanin domain-containing protein n=1 Tax=Lactuca saligna TaxID=75948 RepID=A0AA36DXH7_LACSI|nr:unnamed protein product [Lactuca saligna]